MTMAFGSWASFHRRISASCASNGVCLSVMAFRIQTKLLDSNNSTRTRAVKSCSRPMSTPNEIISPRPLVRLHQCRIQRRAGDRLVAAHEEIVHELLAEAVFGE